MQVGKTLLNHKVIQVILSSYLIKLSYKESGQKFQTREEVLESQGDQKVASWISIGMNFQFSKPPNKFFMRQQLISNVPRQNVKASIYQGKTPF